MKFPKPKKILFLVLAATVILAAAFVIIAHPKSNKQATAQSQPAGTCAPNLSACAGNPKLCMDENKAPVCN